MSHFCVWKITEGTFFVKNYYFSPFQEAKRKETVTFWKLVVSVKTGWHVLHVWKSYINSNFHYPYEIHMLNLHMTNLHMVELHNIFIWMNYIWQAYDLFMISYVFHTIQQLLRNLKNWKQNTFVKSLRLRCSILNQNF